MIDARTQRHAFLALLAAALFGASTPAAKWLLGGGMGPMSLAALLYLGCGAGLLAVRALGRILGRPSAEAPLTRRHLPWLAGSTLCGGIAAPVLLFWGLAGTSASVASLLLSTEGVMTTLISALVFREAVGSRVWAGALVMLAAGAMLTYSPGADIGFSTHALAVAGACALWGLDNNLTRPISEADPATIAMVKGCAAGSANGLLALGVGEAAPAFSGAAAALLLGSLAYGASLLLYVIALRHLGSARTAAHFGTAPFVGAVLSVATLGETVTPTLAAAFALAPAATWIVLGERHGHAHEHGMQEHAHRHTHDAHHGHAHSGTEGPEPHSHPHRHEPMTHAHPHLPDLHHRHPH